MLNALGRPLLKRIFGAFVCNILLLLLLDFIMVHTAWHIKWFNLDYVLYVLAYLAFIISLIAAFKDEHYFKAWIKRVLLALLLFIAFMLVMLPLMLMWHQFIGGKL